MDFKTPTFAQLLCVAAVSALTTFSILVVLRPDVFLDFGFFSTTAFSVLFFLSALKLDSFFQNPSRTLSLLFVLVLAVGWLDLNVLTGALFVAVLVVIFKGPPLYQFRNWITLGLSKSVGNTLIPAFILGIYNLFFVVSHVPEFFSPGASLGGDPDWLFQLLLSKNVNQFGVVTTALDGIPMMQYHWLPYFLVSSISNISGATIEQVLILFFAVFINPLLLALVIWIAIEITGRCTQQRYISMWVIAVLLLGGLFPSSIITGGFYIGAYASVGVLFVFLFLLSITERSREFWTLSFVTIALVLSKTPFGVMAIVFLGVLFVYNLYTQKRITWALLGPALLGGSGFLIFWFGMTDPEGNGSPFYPGEIFELFHIRWMFANSLEVSGVLETLGVVNERQVIGLTVVLAIFAIYWPLVLAFLWRSGINSGSRGLLVTAMAVGVLSSIALSLRFFNGHHVYLAGFGSLIAIPFLIGLGVVFKSSKKVLVLKTIFLSCVLILGGVTFGSKLSEATGNISRIVVRSGGHALADEFRFLRELPNKEKFPKFLVFIGPDHKFWRGCGPSKAFQIPLNAARPALRGLVYCQLNGSLWSSQNYYWWSYGYSAYSPDDFAKAQKPNPEKQVLCEETTSKGFLGYFEIQSDLSSKTIHCD